MKNQSNKKKGKGAGANPEHEAYVAALKGGISSAITDFDYLKFEDGSTLIVVSEESS